MNEVRKKLLNAVSKTVQKIARHEAEEWPPVCIGRYYQPERPAMPVSSDKNGNRIPAKKISDA